MHAMRMIPSRDARRVLSAAMALIAVVAVQSGAEAQQGRRAPPAQLQGPLIDYERVLYAQPRLIDEVMAGVAPSDPSEPSTYFLGFAAWSQQDVFIREAAQARDVVDERLGTARRSVLLVNHVMALEEVPIASVTNLELVLARLGRIMKPEKDTLILFLTSHGIENLFGVQFPPLPLNHLTPPRLREMLDKSGIRSRIVIISACHSGSFLPALRDPDTLVMTAARSDRTSFGCDNKSDWTFFGNALFNHALRKTTSLPDAFSAAKVIIAGWEAAEKFTPSEPQLFVGERIGTVVERLARLGDAVTGPHKRGTARAGD